MMRWNGFARSLAYGGVAAAGHVVLLLAAGPVWGYDTVGSASWAAASVLYVAGLTPSLRRGLAAAALAGGLVCAAVAVGGSPTEVIAGSALAVAVARSVVLYRARPLRAVLLEAALFFGGLSLAAFVGGPGPLGHGLAMWAYFLVQSLFFVAPGTRLRRDAPRGVDAFEVARDRLEALLAASR